MSAQRQKRKLSPSVCKIIVKITNKRAGKHFWLMTSFPFFFTSWQHILCTTLKHSRK
uniref:Uncharacterized protein n=1 Tax=Lepeophtheirus salmonis TaxID=72036 RepID=A0A0K2TXH6_LEPSM